MERAEGQPLRTFIAIELPDAVKEALLMLSGRLRRSGVRASWVKPDAMHLTLRFLGEIPAEDAARIADFLAGRYQGLTPFEVHVSGTGAFPSVKRPSVVWAGAGPFEGPFVQAQAIAEEAACAIGLPREKRPFHPHLTLARVKEEQSAPRLTAYLARENEFRAGSFLATSVSLFSSQLTPQGALYDRLKEFVF